MWNWLKDNGTALIALATILTVILTSNNAIHHRLNDIRTDMNQRFDAQDKYINQSFDAVNQRFDAQDKRLDRLTDEVSEVRRLSDRITRNDMRLDTIEQQLQTADAP